MKRLLTLAAIASVLTSCGMAEATSNEVLPSTAMSVNSLVGNTAQTPIYVTHDDMRDVTCWVLPGSTFSHMSPSMSCVPDTLLADEKK